MWRKEKSRLFSDVLTDYDHVNRTAGALLCLGVFWFFASIVAVTNDGLHHLGVLTRLTILHLNHLRCLLSISRAVWFSLIAT